jgi:hypothetical protein
MYCTYIYYIYSFLFSVLEFLALDFYIRSSIYIIDYHIIDVYRIPSKNKNKIKKHSIYLLNKTKNFHSSIFNSTPTPISRSKSKSKSKFKSYRQINPQQTNRPAPKNHGNSSNSPENNTMPQRNHSLSHRSGRQRFPRQPHLTQARPPPSGTSKLHIVKLEPRTTTRQAMPASWEVRIRRRGVQRRRMRSHKG